MTTSTVIYQNISVLNWLQKVNRFLPLIQEGDKWKINGNLEDTKEWKQLCNQRQSLYASIEV